MDLIPGFFQGIVRVLISHPFDYIRLHLQTNNANSINEFLRKNSYKNLYRGIAIPLITVPIDRAIQFKIYETLNRYTNPFVSGGICGIISSLITLPSNYLCNNFIINEKKSSLKNFIIKMYNEKKYIKFTYGYKPELLRSILGSSIYLGVYGNLRNIYGNDTKQSIINSSIAGILVWTITFPIDTIKVEQQINNNSSVKYILINRVKTYGVLNLWKGILPIYIRTLPSSIIGMTVYEKTKKILSLDK
jgi:hypothetical protein